MKFRRGVFRRASSYAPFVCMSCLAGGTTASAQAVNHRVWVGVGALFTNVAFHCADCRSVRFGFDDRLSGIGVNVGIGWVATKQFRVGVEASAWATHDHGTGNDIVSILAVGSIRPVYALPLRVRAGFGGMRYWEGNTSIHRGDPLHSPPRPDSKPTCAWPGVGLSRRFSPIRPRSPRI